MDPARGAFKKVIQERFLNVPQRRLVVVRGGEQTTRTVLTRQLSAIIEFKAELLKNNKYYTVFFRNMQGSISNCAELNNVPVNDQRLYTHRTILSEDINRTKLSREFEKHSKRSQLSNENYDDDEDDAEFFNNIKKKIFKEDASQYPVMYTSTRKTSRLDENFWKVMKNFKQNLKKQRKCRVISPLQEAFRKKERKSNYPSNSFESGNEDAFSSLERRPLDCEINSTLGDGSRRTSTHAPVFSFSDDITLSPAVLSLRDERLEKEIEKEVYYISANRLMDLCEKVNVQSPTTSFSHYPSLIASSIISPYRQFDSEPE